METTSRSHHNMLPVILSAVRRHWLALAFAAALNLGDAVSTHFGLRAGLPEGNPIPAAMLALGGEGAMHAIKWVALAGIILLLSLLDARYPRLWRAIHVTNAMTVAVLLSNFTQVASAMR